MNGKYVVKMGEYYLRRRTKSDDSIILGLVEELRYAKIMLLQEAIELKQMCGGEVLRINLELEEVE